MDCIYDGEYHLTLEVPGHPARCHVIDADDGDPDRWPYICLTRPGPDGHLGPVRQILAERLDLGTEIQGFGLRWTAERVLAAARAGGYGVETTTGADGRIARVRASGKDGRVDVLFSAATGLSREVVWPGPREPKKARLDFTKALALRFGLSYELSGLLHRDASTDRRKSPVAPVVLDLVQRSGPGPGDWHHTVHLIDLDAPEATK
ncbi:MAG: hypothetical protein H7841_16025 [Magnetospirillum sp. WYHS-4]